MLDVFEYPWLLLAVSLALFMIVGTLRSVFPEKRHWCQMAIPLLVAAGAVATSVFSIVLLLMALRYVTSQFPTEVTRDTEEEAEIER